LISDEKFVNTIKIVALKNAIDFNNTIKVEVVISKAFSFSKFLKENENVKDCISDIKEIVKHLDRLSSEDKMKLYEGLLANGNNYFSNGNSVSGDTSPATKSKAKQDRNTPKDVSSQRTQKISGKTLEFDLPDLENAVHGSVITRFPPEPNGYPHIGHAKAAIIDEEYAKKYQGKLILRYDDTNPLKEKLEYYDAIKDGLDWLQVKPHSSKNTSDDIEKLYDYARKLIEKNFAYVCSCTPDLIKQNRLKAISCDCTHNPVKDNLAKFNSMVLSEPENRKSILRYRGDMASQNTAMRDPTLFRSIVGGDHPKVGKKYSLWPTYDFAAPIEDSLDGVTHALRTKEYELRNELYYSILDNLGLSKPKLIEFSRLEFEGIPVSKRKITPLIEKGIIKRWDDPRLPTLMALRRRGFLPEAIRKFVLSLSITLSETKPSIEILESFNRKLLDPISLRLFFVKNPVRLVIESLKIQSAELKNHPTLDKGRRQVPLENIIYISNDDAIRIKTGDTLRLMDLCNIEILSIENYSKDKNDNYIDNGGYKNKESIIIAKNVGNDISHSIPKIQWVSDKDKTSFSILKPLPLYNGDNYNENNLIVDSGYAESFVLKLPVGTCIQFVRYGFCKLDDHKTAVFTHR
jgi:glutamyl-tRNA synthetase